MSPKKNLPDLVTIPQAAKFLRTTRQAIRGAIKRGRLKVVRNLVLPSSLKDYKKIARWEANISKPTGLSLMMLKALAEKASRKTKRRAKHGRGGK